MKKFILTILCLTISWLWTDLRAQTSPKFKGVNKIRGSNAGYKINPGDFFGEDVKSIGDLNGDGVDDLVVTTSFTDTKSTDDGCIYILFMRGDGTVDSSKKIIQPGATRFGSSVAAIGDLDNDGVVDLVTGATAEYSYEGAVYIVFLNTDGTAKKITRIGSNTTNFTKLTNGIQFGYAVDGIGDFDGDGVEDIVATAPTMDEGGNDRGAAFLILLNSNGTVKSYKKLSVLSGNLSITTANSEEFGSGVCGLGDLNGDGTIDLAISSRKNDDGYVNAGALYIIFMKSDGTASSVKKISGATYSALKASMAYNIEFGIQVTNLSVLSSSKKKESVIGVGAWYENGGTGGMERGAVYMLHVDSTGDLTAFDKITDQSSSLSNMLDDYDRMGRSLSAYMGSSGPQVVVSAAYDDDDTPNAGCIYLLKLDTATTIDTTQDTTDTTSSVTWRNSISESSGCKLYPNPAASVLTVGMSDLLAQELVSVELLDLSGRRLVLKSRSSLEDCSKVQFSVSWLKNGCYFVRVNLGRSGTQALRFMKIE